MHSLRRSSVYCVAVFFLWAAAGSTLLSARPAYAQAKKSQVDLNTASEKELEDLPGVGPATAKKIVAGRPYASVDDLEKAGVSKSTIAKLRSQATVGATGKTAAPDATAQSASKTPRASTKSSSSADQVAANPPAKGMVWANPDSKIYHVEGDRWYGKTKQGKYMTEADAIAAGYRKSKQ
jgi:hypothetical protein